MGEDTAVGVDDPYAHVERCDHLTDDGRCRFALERFGADPSFGRERRGDAYACPVAAALAGEPTDEGWTGWADCPHFRSTTDGTECRRCGLAARPMAHDDGARPLLEEHHLAYPEGPTGHEITVTLCRWCHAKVHDSWARVTDDVEPDPEALAARERRRSREQRELGFETARERRERDR